MRRPSRIASLLSSATEVLFGVGLDKQLVGVSHECDYPPAVQRLPRLTRTAIDATATSDTIDRQVKERLAAGLSLFEIDLPLLERLAPDLLLTQAQCDVCAIRFDDVLAAVRGSSSLAHTEVLALNPVTVEDILHDVLRIGRACHAEPAANEFHQRLKVRIDRVAEPLMAAPSIDRPRVACIEWTEPLMLAGNWTPQLIELAGGSSIVPGTQEHSRYWTWEELAAASPDVVIVAPCGFDFERSLVEARRLTSHPLWPLLPAVQNQRVFVVDGNAYLNRSGPRIVDSLEILAHILHPAHFPRPAYSGWGEGIPNASLR